MTEKELLKYKAVAEYERCSSLEQVARLTDRLDQYAFDPVQVTYATYGRECLEQMGADLEAQAFRRFDFEGYGERAVCPDRKEAHGLWGGLKGA